MSAEEVNIDDVAEAVKATFEEEVEEIVDPKAEEVIEELAEEEIQEEVQFTEKELEAKDHGWNPEGKDRDGNTLSAEEYLARKPLFNKIGNQSKRIDDLSEQVGKLVEQNKQIASDKIKERETLMKQLSEAKETALTNLDVDRVRAIDEQINTVRDELADTPQLANTQTVDKISPDYAAFVAENEWANDTTSVMYAQSEIMAQQYFKVHDGKATDKEVYDHIAKEMRDLYPHKFEKPAVRQPKMGNNNRRQPLKPVTIKKTINDIPEDQRAIAQEVMESTGQTVDEYLATYKF